MLILPKHLEWDFAKRDKVKADLEAAVAEGELSQDDADYLLSQIDYGPFIDRVADFCFVCGEKLTMPAVMWHGHHGTSREAHEIWFHPHCVAGFTKGLLRDAQDANPK